MTNMPGSAALLRRPAAPALPDRNRSDIGLSTTPPSSRANLRATSPAIA